MSAKLMMFFNNRRLQSKQGFTLIELLVVMIIIGILITLFISNFTSGQIKARDAQRKSDLSQISRALEAYYNDNGAYPTASSGKISVTTTGGTTVFSWGDKFVVGSTVYMAALPKEPKSDRYYFYSSNGKAYRLYAKLENTKDSVLGGQQFDTIYCGSGTSLRCNYAVTSSNGSVDTNPDGTSAPKISL